MRRPGLFAFPKHQNLIDVIGRLQPSVVKAFASVTSPDWWRSVRNVCQSAVCILVHGEISDNQDISAPEGDADSTARLLDRSKDWPRLVISKNELPIWSGLDYQKRVVEYFVRWVRRAHRNGFNVVVGEFNCGWPRIYPIDSEEYWDMAPGRRDQWGLYYDIDNELNDGDYWGLHEYWGREGPKTWWPWTCGRHTLARIRHKIIIDECGFDSLVDGGSNDPRQRGWRVHLTPERYAAQIAEYHAMLNDPRVAGTALFLLDYDDGKWSTYDILPLGGALDAAFCVADNSSTVSPGRIDAPLAGRLTVTQTFAQHPSPAKGIDFSCVTGTPVRAAADGIVDKVQDLGNKSYGKWVQVNHLWGFTRYAHLSEFTCNKGQRVRAGDVIGKSGNTGNSTGPHLHFEVIVFSCHEYPYRVDPWPLITGHGEGAELIEKIRNAAWNAIGVPYNPRAAFTVYARERKLGAPLGPEVDVAGYRVQPFRDKILYAQIGDWSSIKELDY